MCIVMDVHGPRNPYTSQPRTNIAIIIFSANMNGDM